MDLDALMREQSRHDRPISSLADDIKRDLGYDPTTGERIPTYLDRQVAIEKEEKARQAAMAEQRARAEKSMGPVPESKPDLETAEKGDPPPDRPLMEDVGAFVSDVVGGVKDVVTSPVNFAANVIKSTITGASSLFEDLYDFGVTTARKYITNPDAQLALGIELPTNERQLTNHINEKLKPFVAEPRTTTERFLTEVATMIAPGMAVGKAIGAASKASRAASTGVAAAGFLDPDQPMVLDTIKAMPPIMQDDLARLRSGSMDEVEYATLTRDRLVRRFGNGIENAALEAGFEALLKYSKALLFGDKVKRAAAGVKPDVGDVEPPSEYFAKYLGDEPASAVTPGASKPATRPDVINLGPGEGPTIPNDRALTLVTEHQKILSRVGTYPLTKGVEGMKAAEMGIPKANVAAITKNVGVPGQTIPLDFMSPVQKATVEQLHLELLPYFGENAQYLAIGAVLGVGIFAKGNE